MIHAKTMHYALRCVPCIFFRARDVMKKIALDIFCAIGNFSNIIAGRRLHLFERESERARFSSNCPPITMMATRTCPTSGGKRNRPDADAKARTYIQHTHILQFAALSRLHMSRMLRLARIASLAIFRRKLRFSFPIVIKRDIEKRQWRARHA